MSLRSDDPGMNRRRLDDRAADALLAGRPVEDEPALTAFVAAVQDVSSAVPIPSAALLAMLDGEVVFEPIAPLKAVSWRRRTWALPLQLGLGGAAAVALVLTAAATNQLPDPAQTAVADVVEAITPLHVPRPVVHPPAPRPATPPTSVPAAETRHPSQRPTTAASPASPASPDDRDGRTEGGPREGGSGEGGRTGPRSTASAHPTGRPSPAGDDTHAVPGARPDDGSGAGSGRTPGGGDRPTSGSIPGSDSGSDSGSGSGSGGLGH